MAGNTIIKKDSENSSANSQIDSSPHKIFLIGMMGSGKSYWAEKLKKRLKIPAYDLDVLVEMMEERTVSEIFEEDGEEYFRKAEAKMLRLFAEKKQFILSCGGGTACYHDNMKWMNKHGITLWLDEPVDTLVERLVKEKKHRPLIKHLDDTGLKDFLNNKLQEREPFYSQATYRLSSDNLNENFFKKILKEYA
ncbi:shikimate kinase [Segetibacter koreensis]|uniref:shikimate kinase n=1 Tax=Segetibacter koreensis TaxID=398037 RepID=UPI000375DF14|nr:shikimate kinase [Segetibacter koreensis]